MFPHLKLPISLAPLRLTGKPINVVTPTAKSFDILQIYKSNRLLSRKYFFDYEFLYDYGSVGWKTIKVGKGRKGKPHWRYFRALKCDKTWKRQWENIVSAYNQYAEEAGIYKSWMGPKDVDVANWLRPQLINATIRFDPLHNKNLAVDFDDEAARTQFILTWA